MDSLLHCDRPPPLQVFNYAAQQIRVGVQLIKLLFKDPRAESKCLHPTNLLTQENVLCGFHIDCAARALVTPLVVMSPTHIFVCSHNLLTRPDLKQVRHFMQCPVHVRSIHLVECIYEHLVGLMEKGPDNLASGSITYVSACVRCHLFTLDKHGDWFERECLLYRKICGILGT